MYRLVLPLLCCAYAAFVTADDEPEPPGFNEATFKGLAMRSIGPAFMSGRISDIVIDPRNRHVWYVGVGSGGIFKTVNAGTTWDPIFEDQGSYSIGCLAIDPNNPDTVWVGTGENHSGRHVGYGDGIYRSRDGGASWENMGLEGSERIGMIRIDPRDSNVVYAAAQGPLWSGGGDRGLYKTTDGGENWSLILEGGQYTGVSEVHMDPRDPDVLYAVKWQRMRSVAALMDGGPETGIWKSTDAGATWRELTSGLPKGAKGKTGMAVSPINPDVVYATIEMPQRKGEVYRSENGGESWTKGAEYAPGGTGPHYYNEIFASPHDFDRIYHMDVFMHVSDDGGKTFTRMPRANRHVDHHALAFWPKDSNYILVGNDGGVYESFDKGDTWRYAANLPITQFYKVSVDYDEPFYNVYGGTQDNNTQGGPSRTMDASGIGNADWYIALFGDGHQPFADPTNPDIVYAQWQQGNLVRYDHKSGEQVYIKPQPGPGEEHDRFNWDAPILISPHDPKRLYFAAQRLWRSDDQGDSWTAISGDLSRGIDRMLQPIMDRVWSYDSHWDLYAMSKFGTIANISESPLVEGLLYVGTDDGQIHISDDGGDNWRRGGRLPGVPEFYYVNDIRADLHDADTVYIVVDDHKKGDFRPFVLKSENRGRSWRSITGNLPERHIVWRIVQDHVNPNLLFVGTEFGVFFTVNGGGQWTKLAGNTPNIPFRDLVIQRRENDLVGATFGRGFYILDDYTPLRNVTAQMLREQTMLFPVRDARWYVPRRALGCSQNECKASQGAAYYKAPNPDFGANFTYYLPDTLRSMKDQRREREKPREKAGEDTPTPGWDALAAEAVEDAPAMVLTVRDSDGQVVRYISGPVEKGFQRVAWDLRYANSDPWVDPASIPEDANPDVGVMAAPGEYSVTLSRRVDGRLTQVGEAQTFNVRSIREAALPGMPQTQRVQFALEVDALSRDAQGAMASLEESLTDLAAIKNTLGRSTAPPALYEEANALTKRLHDIKLVIGGSQARVVAGDPGPVSIYDRLGYAGFGDSIQVHGPTQTQRQSLAIGKEQFAATRAALDRILDQELPALKRRLDDAGVPWSPGR